MACRWVRVELTVHTWPLKPHVDHRTRSAPARADGCWTPSAASGLNARPATSRARWQSRRSDRTMNPLALVWIGQPFSHAEAGT